MVVCLSFVIPACPEGDTAVFLDMTAGTAVREAPEEMVDAFGIRIFGRVGDFCNIRHEKLEVFEEGGGVGLLLQRRGLKWLGEEGMVQGLC